MRDYLQGKQYVETIGDREAVNACYAKLAKYFGEDWLQEPGTNPLQRLWQSPFAYSINEIANFGNAFRVLESDNSHWLNLRVPTIKGDVVGSRNGDIFEVVASALYADAGHKVVTAAEDNPGYDCIVSLESGFEQWTSIKNHGTSSHEEVFQSQAEGVELKFREWVNKYNLSGIEIRIMRNEYPDAQAWEELGRNLEMIIRTARDTDKPSFQTSWDIFLRNLDHSYFPISGNKTSTFFFLSARMHPNEQNNFKENIRKGCENFLRNTPQIPDHAFRAIVLRLGPNASIKQCQEWLQYYFNEYPQDAIGMVLLYQTAITNDLVTNTSNISHYFFPYVTPHMERWKEGKGDFKFPDISIMVGVIATNPIIPVLITDSGQISLDDFYLFQRGDIYKYYEMQSGSLNLDISNPAPGVIIHAEINDEGHSTIIEYKAPDRAGLLLLP